MANFNHTQSSQDFAKLRIPSTSNQISWASVKEVAKEVEQLLQNSRLDTAPLYSFLDILLLKNVAAHTIFGEKPLSVISVITETSARKDLKLPEISQWYHWQNVLAATNFDLVSSYYEDF